MKRILYIVIFLNFFSVPFIYSQEKNDSLLNIYYSTDQDSNKIMALHQYIKLNYAVPDSAIKYSKAAIELAKANKNIQLLAKSYNLLAVAYYYTGDLNKSHKNLNTSLSLYTKIKDKSGMATCYNGIGVIYYDQGKLYKALQLYIQSLRIKEKLGDKTSIAMTLNNIGNVYKDLDNFQKSLEYYNKSLQIKEEIDDKHGLAMTLNNIGLLYHNHKKYIKALNYYSRSIAIKKEINDLYGEAMTLNNIGLNYELQEEYKKALEYYEKSIAIKKQIDDQYGLAMTLINTGTVYREVGNFNKCFEKLLESEKIAQKIGATTQLRDCYQRLYETYEMQGNTKKAYNYYKAFIAVKDSMMNEESMKNIQKLQAQYENEKKQLTIENLSKNEELHKAQLAQNEAEIASKNTINISLIIGLVISIGLIIFFIINAKQRARINQTLTQSLKEKEVLFKEVHHRVKNNFQIISSLLNLHADNTDNEAVKKALGEAKDRVGSMALVHEKLYQSDDLSRIKMDEYINQLTTHLLDGSDGKKEIKTIINVHDVYMNIETAVPLGLIFNELITNSLKYAFKEKVNNKIEIGITENNGEVDVIYKDNGIGLPDDFNLDNLDSLGLNLVQILVLQIHGELKIDTTKGTQYSFHFKLPN